MKPAPHPRAVRKPRKPRDSKLVIYREHHTFPIRITDGWLDKTDLRLKEARAVHKKLGEFLDWIDAQQPARRPAGKGR